MTRRVFYFVMLFFSCNISQAESPSILDLVVIGKDTIVASTHDFKIIVSYDGGRIWETTKRELVKQLGLEGKRIWGIDSWIGIHEGNYSRLYYSDDFGRTWQKIILNPEIFFAMQFLEVNNKLFIVDAYGSLWEHKKTNVESSGSWSKITSYKSKYTRESMYAITKTRYSLMTRDSFFIYDFATKRTIQQEIFNKKIRAFCFIDNDSLAAIDYEGSFYKYSIRDQTYIKVMKIEGYRHLHDILFIDKFFFIIGTGNDAVKDYVLFSILNSVFQNEFIQGISGLDQDICYVDKYKRIWCGTTDGLFVLNPKEKIFKKIL